MFGEKLKAVVFSKAPGFFIKGQHHPKSVFNSGPKVGPALNKKTISIRFFIPGFHCHMENNKAAPSAALSQRGGALRAPPLWVFIAFHLAVETRNKTPHGDQFLFRTGPTFGPELKTDFGWCWPLIKNPGALIKTIVFC